LSNKSFTRSAASNEVVFRRVAANIELASENKTWSSSEAEEFMLNIRKDYECDHVTYEPSVYLWDYLKKSKANGFFLALSGGADSAAVALVVYNLCKLLFKEVVTSKKVEVLAELRTVLKDPSYIPNSPE
jgi:NAD+ synthase (glutamine-hydrolysing)